MIDITGVIMPDRVFLWNFLKNFQNFLKKSVTKFRLQHTLRIEGRKNVQEHTRVEGKFDLEGDVRK